MMADTADRRLVPVLESVGVWWLVVLPLLRPLIWNGEPGNLPNLFYLVLLGAATATGLILRGLSVDTVPRGRPWAMWLGAAFLLWAAVGCLRSPVPMQAWLLWFGWALHLAAPLALWPVIRRAPQALVAGLLAGVGLELIMMVGQVLWERPELQRTLAEDPSIVPQESMRDQFTVRVYSWRLEGTFLLANTVATYLAMIWPLAAGLCWRCWRNPASSVATRWWLALLTGAITVGLALTGSKAGILSWTIMVAAAVVWRWPRFRWPALAAVLLFVAVALAVPAVRAKAAGSLAERIGYWRGAATLVAERPVMGWGVEGFSQQFSRVKPPETEPTVFVHQETLQAACDLGLIGAALLVAWWFLALRATMGNGRVVDVPLTARDHQSSRGLPLIAGCAVGFAILGIGVLNSSLRSWPQGMTLWWLYGVMLAVLAGLIVRGALVLPRVSPLAAAMGVAVCLLHAQADFHLHSMQVVGIVAWLAVLGATLHEPPALIQPAGKSRETGFALAGMGTVLLVVMWLTFGAQRSERLERTQDATEAIRRGLLFRQHPQSSDRELTFARLNHLLIANDAPPIPDDSNDPVGTEAVELVARQLFTDAIAASTRWPADLDLARSVSDGFALLHDLRPAGAVAYTEPLRALLAAWPDQPFAVQGLANHCRQMAARDQSRGTEWLKEAQGLLLRAVGLSPGYLPLREQVVAVSKQLGDQATAERETANLHRLAPVVHETGRAVGKW